MHGFICRAITVTLLILQVSSQENLPNDVMLSGLVHISGINMAFYHGAQHDQASLLSTFESDVCNYVAWRTSPVYQWGFRCSVETSDPATSHVTVRLSTPKNDWISSEMPPQDSFVEAYVGFSLAYYAPSNTVTTYEVAMPNTLFSLPCTALPITSQSGNQYRTPFKRSNQTYLELQRAFCSVVETHRTSDPKFRNVRVECGITSVNPTWIIVELYLIINNNDLETVGISQDKNAIALAAQNTFADAVFRHNGVTYAWQITDPHFLLRGRIHRSGQLVHFDSEQQASESQELSDLVEQICTIMDVHESFAVIDPDKILECKFKRYNTETAAVTIFLTVRTFDHVTIDQLHEALSLPSIIVQDGDIDYEAEIVNHENLAPQQVTIISSTVNALHYDLESKESVIDAFHRINEHVCNHLHPQLSHFANAQCNVISFDPVTRVFEAHIAIPLDELDHKGIEIEAIHFDLTSL